jgi:hypothetical protein
MSIPPAATSWYGKVSQWRKEFWVEDYLPETPPQEAQGENLYESS